MNVSPNELRKETVATLNEVNFAIKSELTNTSGPEVMATLLLAKAQCLSTLTLLNAKRN